MLAKLKAVRRQPSAARRSRRCSLGACSEELGRGPTLASGIEGNATASRERILSNSEIPLFWRALDEDVDPVTAAALKTILAVRPKTGRSVEHAVRAPQGRLLGNAGCSGRALAGDQERQGASGRSIGFGARSDR